MFDSLLVANRGEIASRVIRTARRLGIKSIAVYSDADAELPFVNEADEAVRLGPPPTAESYLNIERLLQVATETGAAAVHPGYGFLSESPEFAYAVAGAGLTWVGPEAETIEAMGNKVNARNLAESAGVPVAPGSSEPLHDVDAALRAAAVVGYPIMVKAAAGGGGIGMSIVQNDTELQAAFGTAQDRASRFFGSAELLLERYVQSARHIEVQILGLADGQIIALGERDCSVQRRHQKIVEETPAPGLNDGIREALYSAAVQAGKAVDYRGAGTVEFLFDTECAQISFLEMNTRLQVEHPVTELVTGIDLVEAQLRIAAGEPPGFDPAQVFSRGHAVEFRIYAEDSTRFLPSPGRLTSWRQPVGDGIRVDAGYAEGNTVTPYYDPLLAKLCAWGETRDVSLARARQTVADFVIRGPKTNLEFLAELLDHPAFCEGHYDTQLVAAMRPAAA